MRTDEAVVQPSTAEGLVRGLRRWDVVALVVNSVIGSGIYGLPSRVYGLAGAYSLFAYVASALAIGLIVLSFAEVGSRFKATGGPYLYTRVAFGPVIGFEIGWLTWFARIASFAALCNLGVGYLAFFVPGSTAVVWRVVLIAAVVSALAVTNIVGVRVTAMVTNIFTVGKLIPLLVVVVGGMFVMDPTRLAFDAPPSYAGFSQAALLLVYTYTGFEGAVIPAGEMRDPGRHVPFALVTGLSVIVALYVLVQAVCIGTVADLTHSERPLADAALAFLGAPGASLIALGAIVSVSGTMNAHMFATPRLLFGMAQHGQLPRVFLGTHARFHTPVPAILLTAVVALGLTIATTFISALTISAVIRLLTYGTTALALPVLRRRSDVPMPAFAAPAGPTLAVGAAVLSVWLMSSSTWAEVRLVIAASIVGLLLYALSGRHASAER